MPMPYWVFNEEQLEAAVREYVRIANPRATPEQAEEEAKLQLVFLMSFLTSEPAHRHRLVGGA